MGTVFSGWLRVQAELDSGKGFCNSNLDYLWFNWREAWLITIEEKTFGGRVRFPQSELLDLIRQAFGLSSGKLLSKRGKLIEYRGHYDITFEKNGPDDSSWIVINEVLINQDIKGVLHTLLTKGVFEPELEAIR